jgi:hypothetical protein
MEVSDNDKRTSLLWHVINYGTKMFYRTDHWACTIKHYGLVIYRFCVNIMCFSKQVEVTEISIKHELTVNSDHFPYIKNP